MNTQYAGYGGFRSDEAMLGLGALLLVMLAMGLYAISRVHKSQAGATRLTQVVARFKV